MKRLLLAGIIAAAMMTSNAQTYTISQSTGITDYELSAMLSGGTKILDRTNNDAFSAVQTLPFNFNFYGTNVTQFKASDNGYITFNTGATASVGTNSNLPAAGDPNNAIYAFWNNWELKAAPNPAFITAVLTRTTGTAPNRKFFIQWFGVSPKGKTIAANADVLAFGIILYENGNGLFEVYFNGGYGASTNSGVVGLENSDGSAGAHFSTGTAFAQPYIAATDAASFPKFVFYPSSMPDNDAALTAVNFPGAITKGSSNTVKGTILNVGKTDITSIKVNYTVDGGSVVSTTLNSLNIAKAGGTYSFVHPTGISESTAGVLKNLKVWISDVNSGADANNVNDSLNTKFIAINGTSSPKVVMMEEATGAWCQHCPDAHTYVDKIIEDYPGKVVVAIHHNSDAMANTESDVVNTAYANGYPSGFIDRTLFSGQTKVGINRGIWNSTIATQSSVYTPVKVNIKNVNYDGTTRKVTFDVEAEFSDYYYGELRIGAMIKEAFVRGPAGGAPDYDQVISSVYTSNASHIYYGYTSPMGGYYHKNVIIAIPTGAWGAAGSIPASVTPGQKVSYTVNYTLPAMTSITVPTTAQFLPKGSGIAGRNKPGDIWLVGFVAKYNSTTTQREILNVNERQMWDLSAGNVPVKAGTTVVETHPNPAAASTMIQFTVPATQKVIVRIVNALGQVVAEKVVENAYAGQQSIKMNTENLANGLYNVVIVGSSVSGSSKLMIAH